MQEDGIDPNAGDPDLGLDYTIAVVDADVGGGTIITQTADVPGDSPYLYQFNAPSFRHKNLSVCNVAFADGSVRGMRWYKNVRHEVDPANFGTSDLVRRNIRIKYPSRALWRP